MCMNKIFTAVLVKFFMDIPISDNDNLFKCTFMIFSCESESLSQCFP